MGRRHQGTKVEEEEYEASHVRHADMVLCDVHPNVLLVDADQGPGDFGGVWSRSTGGWAGEVISIVVYARLVEFQTVHHVCETFVMVKGIKWPMKSVRGIKSGCDGVLHRAQPFDLITLLERREVGPGGSDNFFTNFPSTCRPTFLAKPEFGAFRGAEEVGIRWASSASCRPTF